MFEVRKLIPLILWTAGLSACGAEHRQTAQSAVGRTFDELASAVASCADALSSCTKNASDQTERDACGEEFSDCREQVGREAQSDLAEAISSCQERADACREGASTDASRKGCADSLRACIGEARSQAGHESEDDGGAGRAHAPTYQCFGQLRQCIDDGNAPNECAADARDCVIAAVLPPDAGRPSTKPPIAGGASDPGRGGSNAPSTGGKAGAAGGTTPGGAGSAGGDAAPGQGGAGGAGRGGAAGGRPEAGSGGTAGASDVARECAAAHEACLMSGEKPMACAKEQRKCVRMDSGEDEP